MGDHLGRVNEKHPERVMVLYLWRGSKRLGCCALKGSIESIYEISDGYGVLLLGFIDLEAWVMIFFDF